MRRPDRSDLWGVTRHFNPADSRTKRAHCLRFLRQLERTPVLYQMIERGFDIAPFELRGGSGAGSPAGAV